MAVTSMWPIKGRVDQVINYARNPEKTIESSQKELAKLHAIDGVVEYAANDMKTERRMYDLLELQRGKRGPSIHGNKAALVPDNRDG